ncbi:MAG: phosphoribosyl-ATP diphosphatase [Proteobacteria bacterium]|nr:MAG: phosphoribosyl-ATP diphosphatase [Pseudomonadota bacterium]
MPEKSTKRGVVSGEILSRLADVIESRKASSPESSYVASLLHGDETRVLKKIGEETVELVVAIRGGVREEIIHETADLWFHSLVALAGRGVRVESVLDELERRFGVSGHDEKSSRGLKTPT